MLKIAVFTKKDSKNDFKNEIQKRNQKDETQKTKHQKTESTESILEQRNKQCFIEKRNRQHFSGIKWNNWLSESASSQINGHISKKSANLISKCR